jgi:hypothetical protein
MAYNGQIEYMSTDFSEVEWSEVVRLKGDALECKVRDFQNCRIEPKDDETCVMKDETERGQLKFDGANSTDVKTLRCVIIGREVSERAAAGGRTYYVLVVSPIFSEGCGAFKRVGVGAIPERFILFESQDEGRIL